MTIRLTNYGGTDWSDGEILYAADLNSTIRLGVVAGYDITGGSASVGIAETQLGSDVTIPAGLECDSVLIKVSVNTFSYASTLGGVQFIQYHIYHWDGATETLIETILPTYSSISSDRNIGIGVTNNNIIIESKRTLSAGDKASGFYIRIKANQNTTSVQGNQTALWHNCSIIQLKS